MKKLMSSNKQKIHHDISFYLTTLLSFLLPFKFPVPALIALLFINWLIEGNFKEKFVSYRKKKYLFIFASFFLLHVLALVYTNNLKEGLTAVEVKLSIIIFPLLFFSIPFSRIQLKIILQAFIGGCISSVIVCLARAVYLYFSKGENNFFYMDLSYFMHPGYFSMYLSLASFVVLFSLFNHKGYRLNLNTKIIFLLLLLVFSVFILLLSAKLGILAYFSIFLIAIIIEFIYRKKIIQLISYLILFSLGLFLTYRYVPAIQNRFENLVSIRGSGELDKTSSESTTVRILIWRASAEIIKQNLWLGVSPGDTNDELYKQYEKDGYTGALAHKLNAHNQYLQTFIALGIFGFLLLLAQLLFPLWYCIKQKKIMLFLFLLLLLFNFFTESMLQTQAGVIFYSFFNSLLLFYNWNGTLTENKNRN